MNVPIAAEDPPALEAEQALDLVPVETQGQGAEMTAAGPAGRKSKSEILVITIVHFIHLQYPMVAGAIYMAWKKEELAKAFAGFVGFTFFTSTVSLVSGINTASGRLGYINRFLFTLPCAIEAFFPILYFTSDFPILSIATILSIASVPISFWLFTIDNLYLYACETAFLSDSAATPAATATAHPPSKFMPTWNWFQFRSQHPTMDHGEHTYPLEDMGSTGKFSALSGLMGTNNKHGYQLLHAPSDETLV